MSITRNWNYWIGSSGRNISKNLGYGSYISLNTYLKKKNLRAVKTNKFFADVLPFCSYIDGYPRWLRLRSPRGPLPLPPFRGTHRRIPIRPVVFYPLPILLRYQNRTGSLPRRPLSTKPKFSSSLFSVMLPLHGWK